MVKMRSAGYTPQLYCSQAAPGLDVQRRAQVPEVVMRNCTQQGWSGCPSVSSVDAWTLLARNFPLLCTLAAAWALAGYLLTGACHTTSL